MQNRRAAREAALKSLYAVEVGKNTPQDAVKQIIKRSLRDDHDSIRFAEKLMMVTVDYASEYDLIIDNHIKNWEVDRLAVIDKLILRMALSELLRFKEIPTKVSINEAIELAKKFSTRNSGNFVNGILDAALTHLKEENKINKEGRGLIEESNH
ncbi:MAG: transcription antitermination factor NusB [Balneolaceae bacterium]|nr:transcription antitermination factor NusB [Balneolaceae bacterium]